MLAIRHDVDNGAPLYRGGSLSHDCTMESILETGQSQDVLGYSSPRPGSNNKEITSQNVMTSTAIINHMRSSLDRCRLSEHEIEILESEFRRNLKPNSDRKRELAKQLGIDLARVNNWFQNRRAREKKEANIRAYEARQKIEKQDIESLSADSGTPLPSTEPSASGSTSQQTSLEPQSFGVNIRLSERKIIRTLSCFTPRPILSRTPRPRPESLIALEEKGQEGAKILAQMMGYFYSLVGCWYLCERSLSIQHFRSTTQCENPGSNEHNTGKGSSLVISNGKSQHRTNMSSTKRGRSERHDDDDESPEENDCRRRKLVGKDPGPHRKFACPFFKHNPLHFRKMRSCPGPGWSTTHRLKEHLYRSHLLPISCPRCHETFDSEKSQLEHLTAERLCQKREKPQVEGIDSLTEKILRSRKHMQKHSSEADRWREIYLTLFPSTDTERIPSPYYDYYESEDTVQSDAIDAEFFKYEQFLKAELPPRVLHQLELRIEGELSPQDELAAFKRQIVDIVRDTQLQLFKLYRTYGSKLPTESSSSADETTGVLEESTSDSSSFTKLGSSSGAEESQIQGNDCGGQTVDMDFDFGLFDGVMFDFSGIIGTDQVPEPLDWNTSHILSGFDGKFR